MRIVEIFRSARERVLHRRLGRFGVFDDLAEHILLLELPTRRLVHEERDDAEDQAGNAEEHECAAPAFGAADPHCNEPDEQRAEVADDLGADIDHARHPGADADGVVVGEQRRLHGDVARLGDAREADRPEEHERVSAKPVRIVNTAATKLAMPTIGTRFTRSASHPSGIAPSA